VIEFRVHSYYLIDAQRGAHKRGQDTNKSRENEINANKKRKNVPITQVDQNPLTFDASAQKRECKEEETRETAECLVGE